MIKESTVNTRISKLREKLAEKSEPAVSNLLRTAHFPDSKGIKDSVLPHVAETIGVDWSDGWTKFGKFNKY